MSNDNKWKKDIFKKSIPMEIYMRRYVHTQRGYNMIEDV